MKIKKVIYLKSFIVSLILLGYVLQVALQRTVPLISYYDEMCAIFAYIYLGYSLIAGKVNKETKIGLFIMILTTGIGVISNLYYGVQSNWKAIGTDMINMFKVYITFFASYEFFKKNATNINVQKYLNFFCKMIVLPGFILAVCNLFFDVGMYTEYVYGMRAFHYVFNRVGSLNVISVACIIVLTEQLNFLGESEKKVQKIFIFMALCLLISTLRTRAFAFAIIYAVGYFYFVKEKKVKIKWGAIIAVGMVGLYVAYPKLQYYFGENVNTARSVLLRYGITTAREYWPLGAGFGSYGTAAAKSYWSSLYNKYEFNNYYGMSQENGQFLTDNYWPAIAGEFGFVGLFLMVLLLAWVYRIIIKETEMCNITRFTALFGIVSLTIASTVSSSFFNFTNILVMSLIGLTLGNCNRQKNIDMQ